MVCGVQSTKKKKKKKIQLRVASYAIQSQVHAQGAFVVFVAFEYKFKRNAVISLRNLVAFHERV